MQGCWESLEAVVRLAWAAHCEAQLQAAVEQLRVADTRSDDSALEVPTCWPLPAPQPCMLTVACWWDGCLSL